MKKRIIQIALYIMLCVVFLLAIAGTVMADEPELDSNPTNAVDINTEGELLAVLRQHRTIAEASAVESPIRQETIGFPAHFFARAHNFKPPGRACQPEADSPMRT